MSGQIAGNKCSRDAEVIVLESLRRVNATVARKRPIELKSSALLFGRHGALNSLGLVHLVARIEECLRDRYSKDISLVDDRVISGEIRPFLTVGTLIEYIAGILSRQ